MFKKCVINTCNTVKDGDGITLHGIPQNTEKQQEWFQAIVNETGQTVFHEDDVICSKHFSPESFIKIRGKTILNSNAIPFVDMTDGEPISKRIKVESVTDEEGTYCHATTCINVASDTATLSSSIVYHPFPEDKELARQWKEFCGKTDDNFVNCFVCSEHFMLDDYTTDSDGENVLKSTAVPSVNKIDINEVIEEYEDENEDENRAEDDESEDEMIEDDKAVYSLEKSSTQTEHTTSKMTNRRQYQIMITFMEKHQSIAKGTAKNVEEKSKNQRLWDRLATHLNVQGPPTKNAEGWKRVWRDFKYNVKNKLIRNKKIMEGKNIVGGSNKLVTFSSIEERVIKLCAMRSMIEGVPKVKAFGIKSITTENNPGSSSSTKIEKKTDNSHRLPDIIIEKVAMPPLTTKNNSSEQTDDDNKSSRNYLDEEEDSLDGTAIELLQKQMKLQESYFKEIADNLKLIAGILKEQCNTMAEGLQLREKQFELEKKDFEEKQKYRREKLRIMQEELNVERAVFELRLRTRVNGED